MKESSPPLERVVVYTDGACKGNPGPGGWAARLIDQRTGTVKDIAGFETLTTNNRMELTAAIRALQALKRSVEVDLHSDSSYVINAFLQNWIANWRANGWKNSKKQPVENQDLWQSLIEAARPHRVNWRHVKGHAGHEHNEACDRLAVEAAERARQSLSGG